MARKPLRSFITSYDPLPKPDPRKFIVVFEEVLRLSHSRMRSWRRCEMQHHYKYYQGLTKKKPPTPLFVGSGIHTMIEGQLEHGDWRPALAEFRKDFTRLFIEERQELGDLPGEIEKIMTGYFKMYQNDGLIYVPRHRRRKTEIRMLVDLDARTRFLGIIDAFPQDTEGRNWLMDHKSCKTIPDEETRYADLQLLMYVWLAPQLGYPKPDGLIWDYIRKKAPVAPELLQKGGLSKAVKQDTTYEVYMAAVRGQVEAGTIPADQVPVYDAFAKETFAGREEKFYRRIYLPTPSETMVGNIVKDVIATAEDIRTRGPTATVRNMSRDCKSCSYYSVCQAEVRGLDAEYIRETEYTVKEKIHASKEEAAVGDDALED